MATGKLLVKCGVVTSVQLIDNHLPDRVGPGGTVLGISVALVGHLEVEGVGPDGYTAERGGDGGVVDKELVSHHLKLFVTSYTQEGSTETNDRAISNIRESLNDKPSTRHLS